MLAGGRRKCRCLLLKGGDIVCGKGLKEYFKANNKRRIEVISVMDTYESWKLLDIGSTKKPSESGQPSSAQNAVSYTEKRARSSARSREVVAGSR